MKPHELIEFHALTCVKLNEMVKKKNADYTGSVTNAFKNFERISAISSTISVEQGFLVRLSDKMGRLAAFIDGNDFLVKSESVEDTLDDLANYAILLKAYLKHKQIEALNASIMARETKTNSTVSD